MLLYILLIASLFGAIGGYIDKHLVNLGITRKDYFYYMCLTMIPFSLIMVIVEYQTNQFRFCLNIIPILLLVFGMFVRYIKQQTIVGCLKYLNPYEQSAYLTLGVIVAYVIDVILGIEELSYITILSIFLTITGVFTLANSKLRIKSLRKDILTRIFTSLIMTYITHYIVKYWSIAVYMLFLNLFLTIIFSKGYNLKYNKEHKKIIKWAFVQQIFGFFSLYLSNYLAANSVTLSSYVRPTSVAMVVIISMFFKNKDKKPNLRQLFAILLVVLGVILINR